MVRVAFGGRAYVLGDTAPLSNDGLRHPDSSFLALSLLQRARGGRISFDEYHHGEGAQTSGAGAIFDGPVGLATLLIGLVVLLRHRAERPPPRQACPGWRRRARSERRRVRHGDGTALRAQPPTRADRRTLCR